MKRFIAAASEPAVRLTAAKVVPIKGDVVTEFSSRGPQSAAPDIVKPDVVAPGANILAAFSPIQADGFYPPGDIFHAWQGTSMAAPHVAGAGALLMQAHPRWSPIEIKSALVTTATRGVTDHSGSPPDVFTAGAGRIDPNRATDPGLVLDEEVGRFRRYADGVDPEAFPGNLTPVTPSDLNLPSIGFSRLLGNISINRTFESVDDGSSSWRVGFEGLSGVAATAAPSAFAVGAGGKRTVSFRFTRNGAQLDEWAFGSVVLTESGGRGRKLRMPVALRPVAIDAPDEIDVAAQAAAGSQPVPVRTGYSGQLSGRAFGLDAPDVFAGETIQSTTGSPDLEGDAGSRLYPVSVPAGASAIAGETSNVDGGDPTSDLDLYLYYDDESDGFDDDNRSTSRPASPISRSW